MILTCEIIQNNQRYQFQCLDDDESTVLKSIDFSDRDKAFFELDEFLKNGYKDYVYEICEYDHCHYFKIHHEGVVLLESRQFTNRQKVENFIEEIKIGYPISHIIDKSFSDGTVAYYLTCTNSLQFIRPLEIKLEKEDGEFIASIPDVNLFAYSINMDEAIAEIKEDLDELYADLFTNPHQLSDRAKKVKAIFESKLNLNGVS